MLGNFQHNPDHVPRVLRAVGGYDGHIFARLFVTCASTHAKARSTPGLTAEINGDRFSEDEVIANIIVTMVGGQETTTNLIGNGLLTLLHNPKEMDRLRSDLSLIPSAVEELLRYESPSQHTARITPD